MRQRARFQAGLLAVSVVIVLARNGEAGDTRPVRPLAERINSALVSAGKFLAAEQSPDGAWRSKVYGPFRDGPSLTPYVLTCVYLLPRGDTTAGALRHGHEYVSSLLDEHGRLREPLISPVYTAAPASWVAMFAGASPRDLRARDAWLRYLRGRQLDASLGWKESDAPFGGWGYSAAVPHKPAPGEPSPPLVESNLSATVYALGALRCADVPPDDPAYRNVLAFVRRCQNFSDDPAARDARFDDGGFFFIPGDAAKNKAGVAGVDRSGRTRFHSYGSMTADGVRALLHAGLPPASPRVVAGRRWLEENFRADTNPGVFEPDREVLRGATYYYYCWSVAHGFLHLGVREVRAAQGGREGEPVAWAEALAAELLARQRPDGSWSNRFTDSREDDPLVATPAAAAALVICRRVITGDVAAPAHHVSRPKSAETDNR